jgi:AmmeMemoRadiSam system protein B
MSVGGTFYPTNCKSIKDYISKFNKIKLKSVKPKFEPKAIIVPHAGYIYSGFSANLIYKLIDKNRFSRVVVVGPSHHFYFKGASVALYDNYNTPCGDIPIDLKYSKRLIERNKLLIHIDNMHHEHSTEVQMPFIKHYLPNTKVVEIVYGDIDYRDLAPILKKILERSRTLLVVSTDLSHFHKLQKAKEIDEICIKGVENIDLSKLSSGCEACGLIGLKAIISIAKESQIIDYRTSYDSSGDSKRVVGYLSALIK